MALVEGLRVGFLVGLRVGFLVGFLVGLRVGFLVGRLVEVDDDPDLEMVILAVPGVVITSIELTDIVMS